MHLQTHRVHPRGRINAAGLWLNHTMLFGGFIFITPSESFAPQGKSVQAGQNTGVAHPSLHTTPALEWALQNNSPKSSTLLLQGNSPRPIFRHILELCESHLPNPALPTAAVGNCKWANAHGCVLKHTSTSPAGSRDGWDPERRQQKRVGA